MINTPNETSTPPLRIGSFRTLVRPNDAVVADHCLHGTPVLPGVACLDAVLRAAKAAGLEPERIELRNVLFEVPVSFGDGQARYVNFRCEEHAGGVRVRINAQRVDNQADEQPFGELSVERVHGDPSRRSEPCLDLAAVQRALSSEGASDLSVVYDAARRLGVEHGDFMRATGRVAQLGERLVAELRLGDAARRRGADFLVPVPFLDAAILVPIGKALAQTDAPFLPVFIGRCRILARSAANAHVMYLELPPGGAKQRGDVIETDVRLFDVDGKLVAELARVTAMRTRTGSSLAAACTPSAAPTPARAPSVPAKPAAPSVAPRASEGARRRRLDIAVVGMSGRYPGAANLDELWRNLEAGHDAVGSVPLERWDPAAYADTGRVLSRHGAFLTDVDKFDPLFFGIPPSVAATLDPQERLFLEAAYAAVEHAGYRPDELSRAKARIGVFVGATWTDYRLLGAEAARAGAAPAVTSALSSIANRVSFTFDLVGPSLTVDTACSSSLTALHLACRSIAENESDGAIVGGVNLILHPDKYLLLAQMNMVSSDGRCRAFGAGGDGYVPGEGVGALFLKPVERAESDGDTIHGIIRATAINHGGRVAGFTVPHPDAQARVIRTAIEDSCIDPETIDYIEAHGTGTALGDPIEVAGLTRAFASRRRPLTIGSVKSNVGHLEAAAGVAAVTRALLQLRHGRITPSLHSAEKNPEIDFVDSRLRVPQIAEEWPRPLLGNVEEPRRAGISSFGAGGSNAHTIIEEHVVAETIAAADGPEVVVLSARSEERLHLLAQRLAAHLRAAKGQRLIDIARTLQVGRPAFNERLAFVAADPEQALQRLTGYLDGDRSAVVRGSTEGVSQASAPLAAAYRAGQLEEVARLWSAGSTPDWAALNGGPRRRIPLPGYPFERRSFWIAAPPAARPILSTEVTAVPSPTIPTPSSIPSREGDFLARVRSSFDAGLSQLDVELEETLHDLGRYAALAVRRRLLEMGLQPGSWSEQEIRGQLGLAPAFERFLDACLAVLERHGCIRREGATFHVAAATEDPAQARADILRKADAGPFIRLLDVCLDAYPETLRGRRPATDVLFASSNLDLMAGIYRGNRVYDHYSALAARFVATAAQIAGSTRKPFRILELGAGTGGTSHAALKALAQLGAENDAIEYYYTDVGGSFVAHGRRTFGPDYPFARFRLYDMEKTPLEQGVDLHSIDVILTVGALHAVSDIDLTLERIGELLSPSGLLVLGEAVENHDIMAVTIGLLGGWHLYRDPERRLPHSPLLSVASWEAALTRTGFHGFNAYGPGLTRDAEPGHRVIVAARAASPATEEVRPASAAATADRSVRASTSSRREDAARVESSQSVAAMPDSTAEVERLVTLVVADALGVAPAEIRPQRSFADFGVDSILAGSIVKRLNEGLGLKEKPTILFDYPTVRSLTDLLVSEGARLLRPQPLTEPPVSAPIVVLEPAAEPMPQEEPVATRASSAARAKIPAPSEPTAGTRAQRDGAALDIAIIGVACRYPGASDYRTLWRNVCDGKDAIVEVPRDRWDIDSFYHPWPPVPGKTYSRWGGYLEDIARFDPLFFGIVPAEADLMDPQQRLFLQEAWHAIEDAGIDSAKLRATRCGVFVGAPPSDYTQLIRQRGLFASPGVFTGNSPAILPARIAYHLDLTGPCLGIDTACSSSLVAIHLACRSLIEGDCELALAGGVAVFTTPEHHQLTASLGMLSRDGRCRAFDAAADGIVMSEGVGVVLLKPLQRALADGDPIHGVIKGVAVNQDGHTNGITAPSIRSQTALLCEVHDRFGIDPDSIGYVEAHGTGTKLGDPIEIDALSAAFRRQTSRVGFVPVGSIKTNIGHTSHAAGVAGLIKVLMALQARTIPPSLHFDAANPLIRFDATPFFVNTEARPWPGDRRRAAVSSFGFSGTNCHLVVEEYVSARRTEHARADRALVPLSARTSESLQRMAGALAVYLRQRPDIELHDLAATLQSGRTPFEERACLLARSTRELVDMLARLATEGAGPGILRASVDPDTRSGVAIATSTETDLEAAANTWLVGGAVDFSGLYSDGEVRRIHLPGYAFARDRCWLPDGAPAAPHDVTTSSSRVDQTAPAASPGASDDLHALTSHAGAAATPTHSLAIVRAIVAERLGLSASALETDRPSAELGLDLADRVRIVGLINAELRIELELTAFAASCSLRELAVHAERARGERSSPPTQARTSNTTAPELAAPSAKTQAPQIAARNDASARVEAYLVAILASEARLPSERIRPKAPLQDYGIDSLMIGRLLRRLERDWGPLPSTLFFERQNIRALSAYLVSEHGDRVAVATGASSYAEPPIPATPATVAADHYRASDRRSQGERKHAVTPRSVRKGGASSQLQDIAVIGMAGRFPKADGVDELWSNLLAGKDCISEVPAERWDHERYLSNERDVPGKTYARWGGFMSQVDRFDARFFGITPKDAEAMDPQQRLFLETAWAALEDAGYTSERIKRSAARRGTKDAGVFAGVTYGEYQLFVGIPIAGYWAVANRVSYHLGFNGPSLAVDTACSSSLTAVHLACESLRRGECGYALAGGVNVTIHPGKYLLLGLGHWASSDGRCRAFGTGGDGYVPGEGVATLVLKPLADAVEDGDRVLGVIRASAVNQDGRTNGFTVPNPESQTLLIHEALVQADVDARDVSYVEAHGTGTSLGDPIEVAAATKAFRQYTGDRGWCAIGSAKSAVGHLEAAAGVTGLVKVLLQLRHDTIAPTLHAKPHNPHIDFASGPFRVAVEATPWRRPADGSPRIAAVSSFGAGGSNAHVILQDAPASTPRIRKPSSGPSVVVLSARREAVVREQARLLAVYLQSPAGQGLEIADVAFTLAVGREAFEHRLALTASSTEELIAALTAFSRGAVAESIMTGFGEAHVGDDGESDADTAHLRTLWQRGDRRRVARLWTQGWSVDWETLLADEPHAIVSLPSYPFARDRYWIDPDDYGTQALVTQRAAGTALKVEPASVAAGSDAASNAPVSAKQPDAARSAEHEALHEDVEHKVKEIFADLTKTPVEELDVHSDFLDIGFDSVVSVRMLNRLMKAYGVRIPGAVIEEYTTIRSLVDHVVGAGFIGGAGAGNAREGLVSAARLVAPARTPAKLVLDVPIPVATIFITGVTGVLGGKLLYDLLSDTEIRVTCLVRANDTTTARARVRHFLDVYDVEGRLASEFESRVSVVLGDVSQDRLGLNQAEYDRLAAETDLTIHAAARTTLITFYDALAPVNVEGTQRAIDFALRTKTRYLSYVSSFSVLGDWQINNNPPFRECDIELGQHYDQLPYQETKYHAEKLVRAATDQGLVWNIFRPGNIMGDGRTGRYPFSEVTVKGVFYDIFKTVAETGTTMLSPNHWDISPVDYVSAGLLHLSLRRPSYREVYHLTNPDIRSLYDIFRMIGDFGYETRAVSILEYHRMASERLFRRQGSDEPYDSQTIEMVKYGVEIWGPEHYEQSAAPDCTYTRSILGAAGIDCPTIARLVPLYLQHCIAAGYMEPPRLQARPSPRLTKYDSTAPSLSGSLGARRAVTNGAAHEGTAELGMGR